MRLLLITCLFFVYACQDNSPELKEATNTLTGTTVASKVSATATTVSDSVPPNRPYLQDTARPSDKIRKEFPYDIPMTTADGQKTSSDKVLKPNGKPTVLLFWLTTCYTCKAELQVIQKNYTDWQKEVDFNLYAISTDFSTRYPNFLKQVKESQWPFPAFHDTHREFRKIMPGDLNGLPQLFVLSPKGEIVYHKRKYVTGDENLLFAKLKEIAAK